jgi:hypothetical protein
VDDMSESEKGESVMSLRFSSTSFAYCSLEEEGGCMC